MIWRKTTKSQISEQKMHQAFKTLIRTSFDGNIIWWTRLRKKQVLIDTSLWLVLSYFVGKLLSSSDHTFCLLLTMWKNKQNFSKEKRMKQIIPKEANNLSRNIQRNYPLEEKYFKPSQSFSKTILMYSHSSNNDSFILLYLRTSAVWRT